MHSMTGSDTLLPLTNGSSMAAQFSSIGDLPAVIHIGRNVPTENLRQRFDRPTDLIQSSHSMIINPAMRTPQNLLWAVAGYKNSPEKHGSRN